MSNFRSPKLIMCTPIFQFPNQWNLIILAHFFLIQDLSLVHLCKLMDREDVIVNLVLRSLLDVIEGVIDLR